MFKSYSSFLTKHISILRNIALVLVFILPIIFVAAGLILTTRPITKESPQYNFIYTGNFSSYNNKFNYEVKNNTIIKTFRTPTECISKSLNSSDEIEVIDKCTNEPVLYYHNTTINTSQVITFDEIQKYKLLSNETSPDGFRFERYSTSNSSGIFYLFGNNQSQRNVLIKNSSVIPQSVLGGEGSYRNDIKFLTWHDNK